MFNSFLLCFFFYNIIEDIPVLWSRMHPDIKSLSYDYFIIILDTVGDKMWLVLKTIFILSRPR